MPADPSLLPAVRDCLAGQFALAIDGERKAILEVLEHQLAQSANRDKWAQLHAALDTLRAIGPHLREKLADAIRKRIDARLSPGSDEFSKTARFTASALSLVSEDEVQEEIAVGNTTRRLREATGDQFYAINNRLAVVMGLPGVLADERSPAHPRIFVRALLDVIAELAPDVASKLSALAAHDPALLTALSSAYRDANALLASRGILPDFHRSYGAPQQVPGVHAVAHEVPGVSAPKPAKPPRPEMPAATAAPAAHAPPKPVATAAPLFDRIMANAVAPEAVVNELVASIFRRLADDPHLTAAAKAQIARLQAAVARVAAADRRFFTDPGHPIRGLIDAMAELGAAGSAHHHVDGRLPEEWLADETGALLAFGHLEMAAVAAARDRLAARAQRHHEILVEDDALVRRVRREDEERAAVQDSALEIAHRISSAEITTEGGAFVYETWRPVLIHAHRTSGHGGPAWKHSLATLDDLLWTLAPRTSLEERDRLASLLPAVRDRVSQALIGARIPPQEIESRLAELDRLQAEVRRAPAAVASLITTTAGLGQKITDDVTATLHISAEAVQDEGLVRGSWFEFTEEDGSHLRARLNWLSPVQGACVFKETARNRSFALSLADLRAKRDAGQARPVDGPGVALACIEAALADMARERGLGADPMRAG
ncbi:MAG: DUF1631 family protein [Burkholderiales bacterium]|nr:DUF1631 family protein [Burkholderiales bacterium]